MLYINLY